MCSLLQTSVCTWNEIKCVDIKLIGLRNSIGLKQLAPRMEVKETILYMLSLRLSTTQNTEAEKLAMQASKSTTHYHA